MGKEGGHLVEGRPVHHTWDEHKHQSVDSENLVFQSASQLPGGAVLPNDDSEIFYDLNDSRDQSDSHDKEQSATVPDEGRDKSGENNNFSSTKRQSSKAIADGLNEFDCIVEPKNPGGKGRTILYLK